MKILEFLARVHGTKPSSFTHQSEETLQDEEKVQATISAGAVSTSEATAHASAKSTHRSCP